MSRLFSSVPDPLRDVDFCTETNGQLFDELCNARIKQRFV
jgi:hypothetical protein